MKNKSQKNKQKEYKPIPLQEVEEKEENEMTGHGYFGMPKSFNRWFRLIIIWIVFGGISIFLFYIGQLWAGLISLGCGLMFSLFNNFLRD